MPPRASEHVQPSGSGDKAAAKTAHTIELASKLKTLAVTGKRKLESTTPNKSPIPRLDPNAREAAGDVRQSTNRAIRAEPPPTKFGTPTKGDLQRKSRQQKKGKEILGDGDGSDSDDSGRTPRRSGNGAGSVASRKKSTKAEPATASEFTAPSGSSTKDEAEDDSSFDLDEISKHAPGARDKRRRCRGWSARQKLKIIDMIQEQQLQPPDWIFTDEEHLARVRSPNLRQQDFLDNFLCQNMRGELSRTNVGGVDISGIRRSDMNHMVDRAHLALEEIFESDENYRPAPYLTSPEQLSSILKSLEVNLRTEVQERLGYPSSFTGQMISKQEGDIEEAVEAYVGASMRRSCPDFISIIPPSIQPILKTITQRIISELYKSIEADDIGAASSTVGSVNQQEYTKWVFSTMPRPLLQSSCSLWRQERKAHNRTLKRVRDTADMLQQNISVEFMTRAEGNGEVVLVLFKDNQVNTVRRVLPTALERIGWTQYSSENGPQYWRYEIADELGFDELVFRVNMDGEILGMLIEDGRYLSLKKVWHRLTRCY